MKRIIRTIMALALIGLAGSCGDSKPKQTDTIRIESQPEVALPAEDVKEAQITGRGIGPIKVGMRIIEIKPEVENLYDEIETERGYESNTYHFKLKGKKRFTVYEFESGTANVVSVDDSSIVVTDPASEPVRLGDSFLKVLNLSGVKPQWEAIDGDGMWVWEWQGIWFQPDQSKLTDALVHKLYNQNASPTKADFTEDIKVEYIGTGLPW